MRFLVGTDEDRPIVAFVAKHLRDRGHEVTVLPVAAWGVVAQEVAKSVADHQTDQGVVCCWTGTGVAMAANKIEGARAALCVDAQTAAGARRWNDANVLALSLRMLSEPVAAEILDAWLGESYGGTENESLALLR
ncbi:MAG TPA: RpiB/LacA/LacB family sugar-phosphate isomerase [Polyangiaceae bacterium]|nr:RpiB/LacA/LacB family sugar-phosphate isomerase [Polyangiaceae bacterium]